MPTNNILTQTDAAALIPSLLAAKTVKGVYASSVLMNLVARDWDNEFAREGQTLDIPLRGQLVVNDKVPGENITLQTPAWSTVQVTMDQHKEISFAIDDVARMVARPELFNGYVEDAVSAFAEHIDSAIAAKYAGLSNTIDATESFGVDTFIEGRRLLNKAKAPFANRVAVLGVDAESKMLKDSKAVYTGAGELAALRDAFIGRWYGFDTYTSQVIKTAGDPAAEKNMFFHRNALAMVSRPMSVAAPADGQSFQRIMDAGGFGVRVDVFYDHNKKCWVASLDILYGLTVLKPAYGITVSTEVVA